MMKEEYLGTHIPIDAHGFSKYIMAKTADRSTNIYDLTVFGVFGKYEDWEIRFISNACCKAIFDLPITINQNVYFDYIYVDDFSILIKWFIEEKPKYQRYNVCTSKSIDLYSLAKLVRDISGKNLDIIIANEGFKKEYSGDNSRLVKELGQFNFRDIRESISKLYDFYLNNKHLIDIDKLLVDK